MSFRLAVLMLWARWSYVESALEIAQQCEGAVNISSVVVASGSAGTHAGLAVGLEHLMPESELIESDHVAFRC